MAREVMRTGTAWRILAPVLLAALLLGGASCRRSASPGAETSAGVPQPTVILIGADGLRWDYPSRAATPALDRLIARGVMAERMIPSFPSKTFPNFYTLATGLYPGHHGLVANNMYDPDFDARFSLRDRDAVGDGRWYGGEPIWVTAEKQGLRVGAFFWPGTEAEIGGVRPWSWRVFDDSIPSAERVDQALEWMALPADERPSLVTLYFSDIDTAGHRFGPGPTLGGEEELGPEVTAAIEAVDGAIGRLLHGLDELGLGDEVNLIVVADHGMAPTSRERVMVLDDYVDPETAGVVDTSPVLALWPEEDKIDEVFAALDGAHPHLRIYRRGEIPERLHFRAHRRIAPIVGIADEGWSITDRDFFERCPQCFDGGAHGYDPALASMGAVFIAAGPAFREGVTVPPFENVQLYGLLCRVLGLEPAPNDGDPETVSPLLRKAE